MDATTSLATDPEVGVGSPDRQFSVIALLAGAMGLLGLLAIPFYSMIPVALIAILLGTGPLLFARSWNLSTTSVVLAALGVTLGTFGASWASAEQVATKKHFYGSAERMARQYLEMLREGKTDAAYRLSSSQRKALGGQEASTMYNTIEAKTIERQGFEVSSVAAELLKKGTAAQWQYLGPEEIVDTLNGLRVSVAFADTSLANPRKLIVHMGREPPMEEAPNDHLWFVAGTDWAK